MSPLVCARGRRRRRPPSAALLVLLVLGAGAVAAALRDSDDAGEDVAEGARRRHWPREHRSFVHHHHHHRRSHHHPHQHRRFHSEGLALSLSSGAAGDGWGGKTGAGRTPNAVQAGAAKPDPPPAPPPPPPPPSPPDASEPPEGEGFFLSENCSVVLAQTGSTPTLHCEVADLGESTVSWIRRKDYRLLTVGLATYSSDDRFFTAHVRGPQDWALHVRFARVQDAGLYECQVSTHPPSSLFTELQLVEARAEVVGGPDLFVKRGSRLRLVCLLRHSTEPPQFVFWYHERSMINYAAERGVSVRHGRSSSELVIAAAATADSGNYTCAPSNARPASIGVHVLNGEEPAAMQHGSKSSSSLAPTPRAAHWAVVATVTAALATAVVTACIGR